MAAARIWIMDGHNIIFKIHPLKELQESGRRDEARRGLVDRLRRFARTRSEKVLVVFDGLDLERNPDVIQEPFFEAVYARRSDGEADDRIIHEARTRLEQGENVVVVTDDVKTLAAALPKGVHRLEVEVFWAKHIERAAGRSEKRIVGDFTEVENELEALAAMTVSEPQEPGPVRRSQAGTPGSAGGSATASRMGKRTAPASGPVDPGRAAAEVASERLRLKKEKGRLRQELRLRNRAEPRRRR